MKYTESQGHRISAFTLGTVQLGLPYGVSNTAGQPSREQAFSILDRAVALGVNALDTAAAYGESEQVLGCWLSSRQGGWPPLVVTKICDFDFSSRAALSASIRAKTEASRKRLGLDRIPLLMLHHASDFEQAPDWVTEELLALRADGLVDRLGISLYADNDFEAVAAAPFSAVQLAFNVFDQRLIAQGKLQLLRRAGMMVFVRSVFLQGLVFKSPGELSAAMTFCAPWLKKYRELCDRFSYSPGELAVAWALSVPEVTSLVLGCETTAQVEQNAALVSTARPLTDTQRLALGEAFENIDPRVIDPRSWKDAT